jgi:hypothetical protein
MKVASFLQPGRYYIGLKTSAVYSIPSECSKVYISQSRCSIETRIKEHHQHIRMYHLDKSAMAEHSINLDHHIQFPDTMILAMRFTSMECIIIEATEIKLYANNINTEEQVMEATIAIPEGMKEGALHTAPCLIHYFTLHSLLCDPAYGI